MTATAADVIKGKVIVGPDGEPITGTLELTGNASDGNVLKNKTYYNTDAKTKRTGTMPDHTGVPQHIDARRLANNRFEVAVAAGYHGYSWAGNSYEYMEFSEVAATLGLTAAKLAKGQTVCGIAGTYTSDANAVASNIENAKTAYVNGSKIIGSMATMAGGTYTPGSSDQTISCSGKKMTSNIIIKGGKILVSKVIEVTSSSSTHYFRDSQASRRSAYSITYGALGITPVALIGYNDYSVDAGIDTVYTIYTNLQYVLCAGHGTVFDNNGPHFIQINQSSTDAYLNASGFLLPVGRRSKVYRLWIIGY